MIGDKYQLSDVASFVEQYVGYWTYPVLFCAWYNLNNFFSTQKIYLKKLMPTFKILNWSIFFSEQDVHDELDFRDRISSLEWATKNPEYLHDFDIPDQGQVHPKFLISKILTETKLF